MMGLPVVTGPALISFFVDEKLQRAIGLVLTLGDSLEKTTWEPFPGASAGISDSHFGQGLGASRTMRSTKLSHSPK